VSERERRFCVLPLEKGTVCHVQVAQRATLPYTKEASSFCGWHGLLAQLVRAPALQAGCRGFESLTAHQTLSKPYT
jgi:hypothetical protein